MVVIGVGNSALSDEGVGNRVARAVARKAPPSVEVVDAALPGPALVEILEGREKAVIIDAVDSGRPPGEVFSFRPQEVVDPGHSRNLSLHQGDVLQYVKLAEALGNGPREVVVIGVQPESFRPGERLSPAVEKAVATATEMVLDEVSL